MAGANMSGELARPSVSIPRGTVQAVLTTLFVYVMTAFFMASTSSRYLLQNDYTVSIVITDNQPLSFQVMMDTNLNRIFILIGIFSTTLFSSMSNLIGEFPTDNTSEGFNLNPPSSRILSSPEPSLPRQTLWLSSSPSQNWNWWS